MQKVENVDNGTVYLESRKSISSTEHLLKYHRRKICSLLLSIGKTIKDVTV